jgi:hypothetical protein
MDDTQRRARDWPFSDMCTAAQGRPMDELRQRAREPRQSALLSPAQLVLRQA